MTRYEEVEDGEWFRVPDYHVCCDCNLVHRLRARIRDGKIELKFVRDNRRTAKMRKR